MNAVTAHVRIVINRHIGGYRMAAIISFAEARNRLRPAAMPQMKPQTQKRPDTASIEDQIADAGMLLLDRLGGKHNVPAPKVLAPLAQIERALDAAGIPLEAAAIAARALGIRRQGDGRISLPPDWQDCFSRCQDERVTWFYMKWIGLE